MGATGNSVCEILDFYKNLKGPKPKGFLALHLIITPEYIKKVSQSHPDLKILTARVDRGLSTGKGLSETLGSHPELEKGLNAMDYIVPGAGGVGELINNCYV